MNSAGNEPYNTGSQVNMSSSNYEEENRNESFMPGYNQEEEDKNKSFMPQYNQEEEIKTESFSNHYSAQSNEKDMDDPLTKMVLKKEIKDVHQDNSFTNTEQLLSAQENTILDANQNDSVQTFKNQFSAQGSNYPSGYNLNSECLNNVASF
jgi:hypothetical protein